jgi:long-chain acyl-CoA synthetase
MNKPDGAARISKKAKGKVVAFTTLLKAKGVAKPALIDPAQDVAVLQYTGGTTGTPKAAMLTHQNLVANIAQLQLWFDGAKAGEERILAVLPFFHVFAMTTEMNLGIALGAEIILHPRFEINAALKSITDQKPTIFCGVPTLYHALNQAVEKNSKLDLSSLNYCISGGAPLPATVQAQFEKLTNCTLIEGYGLSETSPVASANPMTGLKKSGSIGLPLPHTEFKITKLDDPSQTAAIGAHK